jgi:DNA-binding PadR family transcriptional regulator
LTNDARITNASIRKLEELHLIEKSIKEAGRAGQQLVKVFSLTDKGKKVARLLKEIEGVLED